ncbi:hypothetical protein HLB25_13330 [Dickeya dadantii]|uniref:hypothetical protein n=1 Tax=Dickeya dadantii TaxID=204038 RepID=UPI001495F826|nr:hypothetical protein [Dickeya dadantii]NPE55885.1 hypothetical protein [Dickeya dadantii]NPE67657.1 hypothetical protein [Dickeya dadantii]
MNAAEKILDILGLKTDDLNTLEQTDSLIVSRIFEAVQDYAMYRDKNPELERECERIQAEIRKHLNQEVIK